MTRSEVDQQLERWRPRSSAAADLMKADSDGWAFALDLLRQVQHRNLVNLSHTSHTVCLFVTWCRAQQIPLDHSTVLVPAVVEAWIESLSRGGSYQHNHTANIRRVAKTLRPAALWGAPRQRRGGRARNHAPYNALERRQLWDLALQGTTARRRRAGTAAIGLGFGAGLRGYELAWAQPKDLEARTDGVMIAVGDRHPRVVPIAEPFGAALMSLAASLGPEEYLTGLNPVRNHVGVVVDSLDNGRFRRTSLPRLDLPRLRASWLVDMFALPLPLRDLWDLAGTFTQREVAFLAEFVPTSIDRSMTTIWKESNGDC